MQACGREHPRLQVWISHVLFGRTQQAYGRTSSARSAPPNPGQEKWFQDERVNNRSKYSMYHRQRSSGVAMVVVAQGDQMFAGFMRGM